MTQKKVLRIAKSSMNDNRKMLESFGYEKKIKLKHNPDEDIISLLSSLMPKSTAGKIAVAGGIALLLYLILKGK